MMRMFFAYVYLRFNKWECMIINNLVHRGENSNMKITSQVVFKRAINSYVMCKPCVARKNFNANKIFSSFSQIWLHHVCCNGDICPKETFQTSTKDLLSNLLRHRNNSWLNSRPKLSIMEIKEIVIKLKQIS